MDGEGRVVDPMRGRVELILANDIQDPDRCRMLAQMIEAEIRASTVHALRESFDPYIGMRGAPPSPEEAMEVMRRAIIDASGFHVER